MIISGTSFASLGCFDVHAKKSQFQNKQVDFQFKSFFHFKIFQLIVLFYMTQIQAIQRKEEN